MTRNAVWPSAESVGGLSVYVVVLLGLAYPSASAEHGLVLPWMPSFAPLTAASRWVSWDGPIVPVPAIGGRVEGGTAAGPPGRVHPGAEKRT